MRYLLPAELGPGNAWSSPRLACSSLISCSSCFNCRHNSTPSHWADWTSARKMASRVLTPKTCAARNKMPRPCSRQSSFSFPRVTIWKMCKLNKHTYGGNGFPNLNQIGQMRKQAARLALFGCGGGPNWLQSAHVIRNLNFCELEPNKYKKGVAVPMARN